MEKNQRNTRQCLISQSHHDEHQNHVNRSKSIGNLKHRTKRQATTIHTL